MKAYDSLVVALGAYVAERHMRMFKICSRFFSALSRPPEGLEERCAECGVAYSCPNVSNDVALC